MQWGFRVTEGTWSPETSNDCCNDSGAGASHGPDQHWLNSFDLCSVQAQLSASMRQCYWSQEWSIDQGVCFSFCSLLTEMLVFLFVQVSNLILRKKITKWPWMTTWLCAVQCCKNTHTQKKKWNKSNFYFTWQASTSKCKKDGPRVFWCFRKEKYHLLCLNSVFVYFLH